MKVNQHPQKTPSEPSRFDTSSPSDPDNEQYLSIPRSYMALCKSVNVSLFLAQAVYWQKSDATAARTGKWQGRFYNTRDQWKEQTGLSRFKQEKARQKLRDMGLLTEVRQRLNTGIVIWYRVDIVRLNQVLNGEEEKPVEQGEAINNTCVANHAGLPDEPLGSAKEKPVISMKLFGGCHPIIYWWMRRILLAEGCKLKQASQKQKAAYVIQMAAFLDKGFESPVVVSSLKAFTDVYGKRLFQWLSDGMDVPMMVPPFGAESVRFAQQVYIDNIKKL
ncbi:hypothetical protein CI610_00333 [invertebrate metagenome]|uniref:Uncharacterized protein n=1 Tax=invertebrate metagenome TaxID=1711999 RepID=A0A2H9TBQ2_9ZZZZ